MYTEQCTVYSKIHLVGGFCVSFVHSTEWTECQAFSPVVRIGPSTAGDGVPPPLVQGG